MAFPAGWAFPHGRGAPELLLNLVLVFEVRTRVPHSYETPPPWDPAVALCQGTYGGPRGVAFPHERGDPVHFPREGPRLLASDLPYRGTLRIRRRNPLGPSWGTWILKKHPLPRITTGP
jgi:hypothetical protein